MKHLKEIYEYRNMVVNLARRELRGKYQKSVLGFLWSFLSPLCQIIIYNIVFTRVFHNTIPNFYIYLMTGILPWTFFAESFGQGSRTIIVNSEMVKKIYFPREVLVISEVLAKLINMLLSFLVMAVFLVVSGTGFSKHIFLLPAVIIVECILAISTALIVSSTTVFFRDLEYIVDVVLMAWIWATPIMYELKGIVDPILRFILYVNPMSGVIQCYHRILYYHEFPTLAEWCIPLFEGIALLVIGYILFNKLNRRFVEEL